jgi:hypothetical protein
MAVDDRQELQRLALLGARTRLQELEQERLAILRRFPGLRRLTGAQPEPAGTDVSERAPARRRRRRRMSAAGRKAVSARMKKYWAARRAAKKTAAKS